MNGQTEWAYNWQIRAACKDEYPELFFPVGKSADSRWQAEQAKTICKTCVVRDDCLKWALEQKEDFGVWGGLTEDERRTIGRRAIRTRNSLVFNQAI